MKKLLILNLLAICFLGFQLKADDETQNSTLQEKSLSSPINPSSGKGKIARFKAKRGDIPKQIPTTIAPKKRSILTPVLIATGAFVTGIYAGLLAVAFCFAHTINFFLGGILLK